MGGGELLDSDSSHDLIADICHYQNLEMFLIISIQHALRHLNETELN